MFAQSRAAVNTSLLKPVRTKGAKNDFVAFTEMDGRKRQQPCKLIVGDQFPIIFDCKALGNTEDLSKIGAEVVTEIRLQVNTVDLIASQLIKREGPKLWLQGGKELCDLATKLAKGKRTLVQVETSASICNSQTVYIPRTCAKSDEFGFVGFEADFDLLARMHTIDLGNNSDSVSMLFKMARLLQQNLEGTPNYGNKLSSAYSSIFADILPTEVKSDVDDFLTRRTHIF